MGNILLAQLRTSGSSNLNPGDAPAKLTDLETIFANVVSLAIGFAGIAFFVMFLIGGFSYLTSGGDQGKVESAKKTLTFAIFGLVFIALAYLILRFIASLTGVNSILNFQISQ